MSNLRTQDGILTEIEDIVNSVKLCKISPEEAKIRMWGCKNAIRIMAIKLIEKRFVREIPSLSEV
jgi:hypothetical protein